MLGRRMDFTGWVTDDIADWVAQEVRTKLLARPDMDNGARHGHLFSIICLEGEPQVKIDQRSGRDRLLVTTEYTHVGTDGIELDELDDDIPVQTLLLSRRTCLNIARDIQSSASKSQIESICAFLPKFSALNALIA